MNKLTEKQKRFIDYYIEYSNATEACRKAGYKGKNLDVIGSQNLVKLRSFIDIRLQELKNDRTASIEDIQAYWTETMYNTEETTNNRLKASEMLYRGKGGFIEKLEVKEISTEWTIKK